MIHVWFYDYLSNEIPELNWKTNNEAKGDLRATIFNEGGPASDLYETGTRYPQIMIIVGAKNPDTAYNYADQIRTLLHRKQDFTFEYNSKTYHVKLIQAMSEPLRLGFDEGNIMEYSVNLQIMLN